MYLLSIIHHQLSIRFLGRCRSGHGCSSYLSCHFFQHQIISSFISDRRIFPAATNAIQIHRSDKQGDLKTLNLFLEEND